jgi:hypothetical protein
MGGTCSSHRRYEKYIEYLVGKRECNKQFDDLGRWEDNVKTRFKETSYEFVSVFI